MINLFLILVLTVCGIFFGLAPSALAASSQNAQPVRALHVVLRSLTVADAKRLVEMARDAGFNTLILDPRDQVRFNNFPGKPLEVAWNRKEFLSVVEYARKLGLTFVPEIKLLTHQKQLFGDSWPGLMFDKETYDPRRREVYGLVFPYLDEIITLLHPAAIHIGHDEVHHAYKVKKNASLSKNMLPAELFYQDVVSIHDYLKSRGIVTWMWGDMLISRDELPGMSSHHLNGVSDYGARMRNRLPKDIVICDWHYADEQLQFPSVDIFLADGFRVLGATFRKLDTMRNFSRYAAQHSAAGMIATTWFIPEAKHNKVVNNWAEVTKVVRESGDAFRRDFPDAR